MAIEERSSTKTTVPASGGGDAARQDAGLQSARNIVQETLVELKKTTWPTKEEATRLTFVVIGVIIVLGIYMGLLDVLLSQIDKVFKLT